MGGEKEEEREKGEGLDSGRAILPPSPLSRVFR